MPKRFTDTEKWKDEWWGPLSNDYRIIWLYLVDSCSIAGLWKKDFRSLNFNCNTTITEEDFLKVFGSRLIDRGNYFFIPKFLRFQCPKGLNSNKPAIVSIVKELNFNNLTQIVNESLGNDFLIIKGKDKGTGKGEGEGKGKDKGKENYVTIDGERIYDVLPVLEYYEAQLNARQAEYNTRSWKDVAPEWFNQNLLSDYNDQIHLKNAFSKYLIGTKSLNGSTHKKLVNLDNI